MLGPRYPIPTLDNTPMTVAIDQPAVYVANRIAQTPNMKTGNETEIVWANDSLHQKTPYAIVYLPGFGASKGEGEPIHRQVAKRYGMNLLLYRPDMYGVAEEEPFIDLTPEVMIHSAKEGVHLAKSLGQKVIVMCCSTGGTAAFFLAANDPEIAAVISYSPNIDLADPMSELLVGPWGHQIARLVFWGNYRAFEASDTIQQWWIHRYRLEGLLSLKALVKATMKKEIFEAVKQPVFVGYYYKNEEEHDQIVSIPRIEESYQQLGTPDSLKSLVTFPTVGGHVLASKFYSEDLDTVLIATNQFIEDKLHLSPQE